MVFLLKDECGRALVIAEASSREEADEFGFRNFRTYCGRIVELDPASRREAEQFWGVPAVRVVYQVLDPSRKAVAGTATKKMTKLVVWSTSSAPSGLMSWN